MSRTEDHEKVSLAARLMFWLPFKKRFSREEYGELFGLLRQETRTLMRRPTYVLGLVVSAGLSSYFVITGLSRAPTDWLSTGLGLLIMFGYACGVNSTREHLCERLLILEKDPGAKKGI